MFFIEGIKSTINIKWCACGATKKEYAPTAWRGGFRHVSNIGRVEPRDETGNMASNIF